MIEAIRLNVYNISEMCAGAAQSYAHIRFDSNNTCNVHCIYCHNRRSDERVELDDFRAFVASKVTRLEHFQIGCIMEPTMDPRMCDFMEAIAASPARATRTVRLQTNGILLHRHDPERMARAGLTRLSVSVDSATPDLHGLLRGGTSLAKVERNLIGFHAALPAVEMMMLTTVTTANIDDLEELVRWGLDVGFTAFELRQMFHHTANDLVDHARMSQLTVPAERFAAARVRLTDSFGGRAHLSFHDDATLRRTGAATSAASYSALKLDRRAAEHPSVPPGPP